MRLPPLIGLLGEFLGEFGGHFCNGNNGNEIQRKGDVRRNRREIGDLSDWNNAEGKVEPAGVEPRSSQVGRGAYCTWILMGILTLTVALCGIPRFNRRLGKQGISLSGMVILRL